MSPRPFPVFRASGLFSTHSVFKTGAISLSQLWNCGESGGSGQLHFCLQRWGVVIIRGAVYPDHIHMLLSEPPASGNGKGGAIRQGAVVAKIAETHVT